MSETNILQKVISSTLQRVALRQKETPLKALQTTLSTIKEPRDFALALQGPGIQLIAEIKRASPSKGPLHPNLDASELARSYARGGAAALSVLTEPVFFQGSHQDLAQAKIAGGLPVLCKDFILEAYQVYEARTYGADAVLLLAALHGASTLRSLLTLAHSLGMSALIEVHNEQEVERAMAAGASLIGINNRNLEDFSVDLNTTLRLKPCIPPEIPVVSESGIHTPEDLGLLQSSGIRAVLIGEALVTSADPEGKIRELLSKREGQSSNPSFL